MHLMYLRKSHLQIQTIRELYMLGIETDQLGWGDRFISATVRNPQFPLDESGVFEVLAATR